MSEKHCEVESWVGVELDAEVPDTNPDRGDAGIWFVAVVDDVVAVGIRT